MIIENVIKILSRDNSVYINGLGLFKCKFVSSSIVDGRINPPHNELTLDTEEEGNGFEFVLFVSKEEGITLLEADDTISKWTKELNEKIGNGELVHIENFGTFLKKDGKTEFESDIIPELNEAYEGMAPIGIPDKTTGAVKTKGKGRKRAAIITFVLLLVISCGFVAYIFREQLKEFAEDAMFHIGREVTLPAVSGAPYASEFAKTNYIDSLVVKEEEVEIENIIIPFIANNETEEKNNSDNFDSNITTEEYPDSQSNTETEQEKEKTIIVAQTNSEEYPRIDYEQGKYYAIVGSLGNERDAKTHAAWKKRIGYEPQLLYQTGSKRIRICVAVFDNAAEAASYKEKHPDCWILE